MTTATGPLADPTSDGSTQRRIDYLPLDDIAPAARNPKEHARDEIVRSVRTFGFTSPVLYDERTERLVAGHGRLDALRALRDEAWQGDPPPDGIRTDGQGGWLVPVVRGWASESDAHAEAYLVADNRLTETGGWDNRLLAELLEDVTDHSADLLAATGYTSSDLDRLLASVQADDDGDTALAEHDDRAAGDDDTDPEDEEEKARSDGSLLALADVTVGEPQHETHLGDVWELGTLPHRLVVGYVHKQWDRWANLLPPDGLFVPYPGPYVALTEAAESTPMLLVQPDLYLAGHVLDKYTAIHGEASVRRAR